MHNNVVKLDVTAEQNGYFASKTKVVDHDQPGTHDKHYAQLFDYISQDSPYWPGFPILGVFRLKGQPKRDGSCEASRGSLIAVGHSAISLKYRVTRSRA